MPKDQKKEKAITGSKSNSAIVSSAESNTYQKEIAITVDALVFTLQKYARAAINGLNNATVEKTKLNTSRNKSKMKNNAKNKDDKKIKVEGEEKLPSLVIEKRALGKENEKSLLLEKFFRSFQRHLTTREKEIILLRYLISEKFEISKTIDNCIKTAEFRRREHLHRMLLFPSLIPLRGYDEANICKTLQLQYGADTSEPPFTLSLSGLPINNKVESSVPVTKATSSNWDKNFTNTACTSISTNAGNTDTNTATAAEFGFPSQIFTNSCNCIERMSSQYSWSKSMREKQKSELTIDSTIKGNICNTNTSVGGCGTNNNDDEYYNVDYLSLYSTPITTNTNSNNTKSGFNKISHSPKIANTNSNNVNAPQVELPLASASLISVYEDSTVHSCISQDNSFISASRRTNSADDDDKNSHLLSRILSHLPFNWRRSKESKVCSDEGNGSVKCNDSTGLAQRAHSADVKNAALCSEEQISFSSLLRNDGRSLVELGKTNEMSSARKAATTDNGKFKVNGREENSNKFASFRSHKQDRLHNVGRERSASASSTTTTTSHGLDLSLYESEDRSEELYKEIEQTTHGRSRCLPADKHKVKYIDPVCDINNMEKNRNNVDVHVASNMHNQIQEHDRETSSYNNINGNTNNYSNKNISGSSSNSYYNKNNETDRNSSIVPENGGGGGGEDDGDADSNIVLDYHPLLEPIITTILRHVPITFHYWDKKGHPVMYCNFAMLRSRLLTDELFHLTPLGSEPVALCALFQAYTLELTQQLIRYKDYQNMSYNEMSKALELPCNNNNNNNININSPIDNTCVLPKRSHVETCVVVLDCANVQYRHLLYRPLLRMMRTVVKLSQEHWPELLHHIYVVNCHKMIRLAYLLIKNTLSESTRRKITFCDRQYTSMTLREVIDKEFLPQEYGGSCNCMGGCLKIGSTSIKDDDNDNDESSSTTVSSMQTNTLRENVTPTIDSPREEDEISWVSEQSSRRLSQRQTSRMSFARDTHFRRTARKFVIRPRQRQSMTFAVNSKEEIIWEFAVKSRRLVSFSAVFIPADGGGSIYSLAATRKVYEDANHYVCPCAGTIIFKWKNEVYFGHRAHLHVKVYRDDFTND